MFRLHDLRWSLLVCFVFICNTAGAQSDFFWSDKGMGEGAVNEELFVAMQQGETRTLYLYYTTNGPSNAEINVGLFLDIIGDPGLEFLSAETLDFDITVAGNVIGRRWEDVFGPTGDIELNQISGLACFGFFSRGMLDQQPPFEDGGYDSDVDAYLVATLDVRLNSIGCFEIATRTGRKGIVHCGQNEVVVIEPQYNCVTICDPLNVGNHSLGGCNFVEPKRGDVNQDGSVDLADVAPFVEALSSGSNQSEADMNQDGTADLLDVQGFVNVLNGRCVDADPNETLVGDTNCDGCIDLQDLATFKGFLSGSPCNFKTADINGDGTIDLLDVAPLIDLILSR